MQKRRILIVDKDVVCMLVEASLARQFNVAVASNGLEALALVENEAPDLILLNLVVPDVDKLVTLLKIRKNNGYVATPVILINVTIELNKTDEYIPLEPVGILTKPLDLKELPNQINAIMAELWMVDKSISILVVDDAPLICDMVRIVLTNSDRPSVIGEASNGLEAVEICATVNPDIILMDVEMPVMNGVEAAKIIRSKNAEVKIIMLTAHSTDGHIFNSFAAGADGYILKNRFVETLQTAIDTVRLGSVWLDPAIAHRLLAISTDSAKKPITRGKVLSRQEIETLSMVAKSTGENCLVHPRFVEKLQQLAIAS